MSSASLQLVLSLNRLWWFCKPNTSRFFASQFSMAPNLLYDSGNSNRGSVSTWRGGMEREVQRGRNICISSIKFSRSVIPDSLRPHGLQHTRLPCPSPTPRVYSNSCPLSQWCHPTISSSVVPFSCRLQSFPASGSFQMSQFFISGVYLWLIHAEVWQKTTKFCKAIILQLKKQSGKKIFYWNIVDLQSCISGIQISDSVIYIFFFRFFSIID